MYNQGAAFSTAGVARGVAAGLEENPSASFSGLQ